MQLIKKIVIAAFIFFNFLFVIVAIVDASTKSYLVTEGTTLNIGSPPGANALVFRQNIFVENNIGGRFVISSTPDGKGDVHIGDELVVSNPNTFKSYSYLATTNCVNFNSVLPPTDITHISGLGTNNFTFVIRDRCARYQEVGPIYLVHLDIPKEDPFLELPWNYADKGLSFTEAALSMSSYFDHEYPLLSSGLSEFTDIIKYTGQKTKEEYTSHDGYDWAKLARAEIGESVLAAGSGDATYVSSCTACGNMILIDHKNGFQTRYLHLQKDGLIVDVPGNIVPVTVGQPIGKIGATGNVIPSGDKGAHIHFGVVHDKNKDGNFEDNIPDGMVDPFGWQSTSPDPWENYTFNYNGQVRTGTKSHYLWNKALDKLETPMNRNGGTFTTGKYTISFPPNSVNRDVTLKIVPLPRIQIDNFKETVGTAILAQVVQSSGSLIRFFSPPFSLIIDFSGFDMDKYTEESLSIYSSENGTTWTKENTTIDWANKQAIAQISHMTQFALVGEKRDLISPETEVTLLGIGKDNIFSTDVEVQLAANDNASGIDYIMYRRDDDDWEPYSKSLTFSTDGKHIIEFYAEDNDGNIEETKQIVFTIEKVLPELQLSCNFDLETIDIVPKDNHPALTVEKETLGKNKQKVIINNHSGKYLIMIGRTNRDDDWKAFWIESLQYDNEEILTFNNTRLRCLDNPDRFKTKQVYVQKDVVRVRLTYNQKEDSTKVTTKIEDEKEILHIDGVKVLKLVTEKGNLIYSY